MGMVGPRGVQLSIRFADSGAFKGHDFASQGRYAPNVPLLATPPNANERNELGRIRAC